MVLARKSIDRATLPGALLPIAKQQLRVTFDDDDMLIKSKIAQSIDLFERLSSYSVFATIWEWTPQAVEFSVPGPTAPNDMASGQEWARIPVMRVAEFSALNDTGADVTTSYGVTGLGTPDTINPQYLYPITDPGKSVIAVTLDTGFVDADNMPPSMVDIILRITGWLYEYREVENIPGVDNVAYANSVLTTWWVPRC